VFGVVVVVVAAAVGFLLLLQVQNLAVQQGMDCYLRCLAGCYCLPPRWLLSLVLLGRLLVGLREFVLRTVDLCGTRIEWMEHVVAVVPAVEGEGLVDHW